MAFTKTAVPPLSQPGPASVSPHEPVSSTRVRNIVAGTIGNAFEWFDWSVYSTFAVFFGPRFFPSGNAASAVLSTFAVFAIGFAMRPLGGWAIGTLSDRFGRRAALTISITMMAGSSLAISLLPTYQTIGLAAPALLVFFRLIQGLAVGGEYAAATTFIGETAPAARRGFYGSFVFFTTALGLLAASALAWLLTRLLSHDDMTAFGWRIPFFIGGLGALVGYWIRRRVSETPAFKAMEARNIGAPKRSLAALRCWARLPSICSRVTCRSMPFSTPAHCLRMHMVPAPSAC